MKGVRFFYIALICAYLLGNYNGYVALWQGTNAQPLKVFPYRIEMLPDADQQKLSRGIAVSDAQELNQLLEDYLS